MKIKNNIDYRSETLNLADAVSTMLEDDRDGIAESAKATAGRTADALANLIDLLADKDILSQEDVTSIIAYPVEFAD